MAAPSRQAASTATAKISPPSKGTARRLPVEGGETRVLGGVRLNQ
jgi:hypothetical protein